jgi:hypothetical protein
MRFKRPRLVCGCHNCAGWLNMACVGRRDRDATSTADVPEGASLMT